MLSYCYYLFPYIILFLTVQVLICADFFSSKKRILGPSVNFYCSSSSNQAWVKHLWNRQNCWWKLLGWMTYQNWSNIAENVTKLRKCLATTFSVQRKWCPSHWNNLFTRQMGTLKPKPNSQLEEELEIRLLAGELYTSTWYMGHHHVWPPSNHVIYLVSQEPPHSIEHSLLPKVRSSIH